MTALDDRSVRPSVTTGPITGSHKVYQDVNGVRVPFRRVDLTNGEHLDLYDTSGPYTDDTATIDVHSGLTPLRADWIAGREPVKNTPVDRAACARMIRRGMVEGQPHTNAGARALAG